MKKTNTPAEREFFLAIANGQSDLVRKMVRDEPSLLLAFDHSCFGATPITRVCYNLNRPMLEMLIELGADINRRSDWSMGPWSPLHCAVFVRNHDLVQFLLDNGAQLDVHTAAGTGRVDDLRELLDRRPERVNEPGGDGCQPLHFADSPEIAQILLDRGANIEARCIDHFSTPVQYLADHRPEVARYLFSKGAKADIFSAVLANDLSVVQDLVTGQPKVLQSRINQETFPPGAEHDVHNILTFSIGMGCGPMHAAAKGNHGAMVKFLAGAGLSPNDRGGYDDQTPLHTAAWNDHREAAESLLQVGADIDARSGTIHNNSPAGWAIVAGSANVFEYLVDQGAEILDWFLDDAREAIDGRFRQFKNVPQENYLRIQAALDRTRRS